jgi:hypothetical protein
MVVQVTVSLTADPNHSMGCRPSSRALIGSTLTRPVPVARNEQLIHATNHWETLQMASVKHAPCGDVGNAQRCFNALGHCELARDIFVGPQSHNTSGGRMAGQKHPSFLSEPLNFAGGSDPRAVQGQFLPCYYVSHQADEGWALVARRSVFDTGMPTQVTIGGRDVAVAAEEVALGHTFNGLTICPQRLSPCAQPRRSLVFNCIESAQGNHARDKGRMA